jgi:hypothetical protein
VQSNSGLHHVPHYVAENCTVRKLTSVQSN